MKLIYILLVLLVINTSLNATIVVHKDINTTIERLDPQVWDDTYYQYKIENNIPYQYNKVDHYYQFNPIYVTYFLKNYRHMFLKTKNKKYIEYSKIILNASLQKSEKLIFNNFEAIAFPYEANRFVARMFHRSYSGLTQGYFLEELANLYKITNDDYFKILAMKFFNSLIIPIDEGGGHVSL